jgi:hypothetical protein
VLGNPGGSSADRIKQLKLDGIQIFGEGPRGWHRLGRLAKRAARYHAPRTIGEPHGKDERAGQYRDNGDSLGQASDK